jgi:hypothetical protein
MITLSLLEKDHSYDHDVLLQKDHNDDHVFFSLLLKDHNNDQAFTVAERSQ